MSFLLQQMCVFISWLTIEYSIDRDAQETTLYDVESLTNSFIYLKKSMIFCVSS